MKTQLIPLSVTLGLMIVACSKQVSQMSATDSKPPPRLAYPFQVPGDSYFVLGNNTADSLDSRYWGALPRENILGKVRDK
jgi:signal peptidase I